MINYNDRPERFGFFRKFGIFQIVFVLLFTWSLAPTFIIKPYFDFNNLNYTTIKVKNKERTCYSDRNCKYLIYTENEVFENTDSWMDQKYNSADIYNQLDSGKTCYVKVRGKRVVYFSWFRNIVEIDNCN